MLSISAFTRVQTATSHAMFSALRQGRSFTRVSSACTRILRRRPPGAYSLPPTLDPPQCFCWTEPNPATISVHPRIPVDETPERCASLYFRRGLSNQMFNLMSRCSMGLQHPRASPRPRQTKHLKLRRILASRRMHLAHTVIT